MVNEKILQILSGKKREKKKVLKSRSFDLCTVRPLNAEQRANQIKVQIVELVNG